jgi:hypothetical protein
MIGSSIVKKGSMGTESRGYDIGSEFNIKGKLSYQSKISIEKSDRQPSINSIEKRDNEMDNFLLLDQTSLSPASNKNGPFGMNMSNVASAFGIGIPSPAAKVGRLNLFSMDKI